MCGSAEGPSPEKLEQANWRASFQETVTFNGVVWPRDPNREQVIYRLAVDPAVPGEDREVDHWAGFEDGDKK